jgi:AcrR family transcriptional regulator
MPRPSRDAEIMDAALAVFAERGYDGTRIRHIAQRAGVSEGALYSHHRSKEAVALALFRVHMTRYSEAIAEVASEPGASVEDRIRRIADRTIEAFNDEPDAVAFIITHQARLIGALPPDFPYTIRIVEALIRAGQRDGSVRHAPVRLLAALVFGCITQPIRTVLEAPRGTISLRATAARDLIADAAWATIAARIEP